ncbi:accessory Sec system glycosylation chaperone GtfB [Jeotgalicoccus huakuii]|nr:accessory Sec system glycosylation chaperone GtfB [Jeotgalicoccus huakuii]
MINLFESFNKKTILLYKSLKYSKVNNKTIILKDDGFLPVEVYSPFSFFSENKKSEKKPLFFNQVEVPKTWEIEGNNNFALIKDSGSIKGKIFYKANYKRRIVERVEWFDLKGRVQFIDYYDKNGLKYADLIVNPETGQRILKQYINDRNEIFLTENLITNDIELLFQGKRYHFYSKVEFYKFYLIMNGWQDSSFFTNSYVFTTATINSLENATGNIIFNQQQIDNNTIKHLENLLSKPGNKYRAMISGENDYKQVMKLMEDKYRDKIYQSGYVYHFVQENKKTNNVLILTNSDQIVNVKDLIETHTSLNFHIVALTEMSNILMKLNRNPNVYLYPNEKISKIKELYKISSIYLDINKGNEILDAVRGAFDYQLLILAYKDTAHNFDVTASENIFDINRTDELSDVLTELKSKSNLIDTRLQLQLIQGASITEEVFRDGFKKINN